MPLLEGLVNGPAGGLASLLSENLFLTVPLLLALALLFFLRPRKAGSKYKNAPPMVTKSTVSSVPLLGPAIEFGKSPVKMVKRCYDDYGPVFTVPVRAKKKDVGMRWTCELHACMCFVLPFHTGPVEHWKWHGILHGIDIADLLFHVSACIEHHRRILLPCGRWYPRPAMKCNIFAHILHLLLFPSFPWCFGWNECIWALSMSMHVYYATNFVLWVIRC